MTEDQWAKHRKYLRDSAKVTWEFEQELAAEQANQNLEADPDENNPKSPQKEDQ